MAPDLPWIEEWTTCVQLEIQSQELLLELKLYKEVNARCAKDLIEALAEVRKWSLSNQGLQQDIEALHVRGRACEGHAGQPAGSGSAGQQAGKGSWSAGEEESSLDAGLFGDAGVAEKFMAILPLALNDRGGEANSELLSTAAAALGLPCSELLGLGRGEDATFGNSPRGTSNVNGLQGSGSASSGARCDGHMQDPRTSFDIALAAILGMGLSGEWTNSSPGLPSLTQRPPSTPSVKSDEAPDLHDNTCPISLWAACWPMNDSAAPMAAAFDSRAHSLQQPTVKVAAPPSRPPACRPSLWLPSAPQLPGPVPPWTAATLAAARTPSVAPRAPGKAAAAAPASSQPPKEPALSAQRNSRSRAMGPRQVLMQQQPAADAPMRDRLRPLPPGTVTLAVRNIPSRYTREMLLREWPPHGRYNLLDLPFSARDQRTMGFAFVNFLSPSLAQGFQRRWHGRHLSQPGRRTKYLDIAPATVQGFEGTLRHLRSRNVHRMENEASLPAIFAGNVRLDAQQVLRSLGSS